MNKTINMANTLSSAVEIKDELIKHRRHLHENPELGFDLPNTVAYVKETLKGMGLEPKKVGKAGLVVTIGKGNGKTLLLRGDMDALPIKENTDLPFKSTNEFMHACGHDIHTTFMLGTAKLLKERENEINGTVKIMFQPAEEIGAGAKDMVANGLMENPKVDAALALHVDPGLEVGKFGYKPGIAASSLDGFFLKVQGKGGHSSEPQKAIDPLMIINAIYSQLNTLVGKEIDPSERAVLVVGKMGGGTAANIIPDSAHLDATLRTLNPVVRDHLFKRIPEIIDGTVKMMRGTYQLETLSTPSLYNHAELCEQMSPYIKEVIGENNLEVNNEPLSGTEDFSYISNLVPTMFMWAGANGLGDRNYPLHNPNVVLDEGVIPWGVAVAVHTAINWINN
ncbi:amidohydrolase [Bacillus sp. ISL-40]|uniref:M20 metallopeptidase family protein n=1 Tax=unclassified Bacillus (in: firmicutes) TaxID=185979 RepID=UPI001BE7F631|nr:MULTISPECIES: M20 family metallopeptidase [unclassified Bacillus (in: firmicutes)]MBT2700477.1 amidohydrolase [Bacillus sp. ISL-40]MBT2722987.1 amidohydrolase [Bacillus sp. ISL-46]MBT2744218.1 amidohydrolase [Bacillus sp. ISL-77]